MLPVHEIAADRVAPAHVAPFVAARIVLIEEVPFSLVEDQSVWVIHPIPLRREMELRPKWLVLRLNARDGGGEYTGEGSERGEWLHANSSRLAGSGEVAPG